MQHILSIIFIWGALILAIGACLMGLTRILRAAREEMKYRRRAHHLRKWVQWEILAGPPRVRVEPARTSPGIASGVRLAPPAA